MKEVAEAYALTAAAWQSGPGVIYDALAETAIEHLRTGLVGARLLDVGAGTGAVTRAARRRGAGVAAVDISAEMLVRAAAAGSDAVAADALALPVRTGSFDAVVAAFSFNHLAEPASALREGRRVLRDGGAMVVTSYAEDDSHPVKDAVDDAARARGFEEPAWSDYVSRVTKPRLATVERASEAAESAGLRGARARQLEVPFPELTPAQLVSWRLGMANLAPFVSSLAPTDRERLVDDALRRLGTPPVLVRRVVVLDYVKSG